MATSEKAVPTSFMEPFKDILVNYLMPEKCYDEFFLNFNFLHGKKEHCLTIISDVFSLLRLDDV